MKFRNSILLWLLTLLGFGSCSGIKTIVISKPDNHDYPAPEYGVPMADYRIMGTVTDQKGNPVKGARVAVDPLAEDWARDTVYTDEKGEYLKTINDGADYGSTLPRLKVKIEDVDGLDNGGIFQTKELRIEDFTVEKTKEESGGWYEGQYTLTGNATVEMIPDIAVEYGPPPASYKKK